MRSSEGRLAAIATLTMALCGLYGCATLDESECRSVDWYQLGLKDGSDGYTATRLGDHREACAEYGLNVGATEWRRGYDTGLDNYCTVDNGYAVGRRGMYYGHVCPAEVERAFVSAYELGKETYDVEQEISDLDRRIDSLETRLSRSEDLSDEDRRLARRQVAELYREMNWLRRSRDRLEAEWRRRF